MTVREKAACLCYSIPALVLLGFGVRYLTASEYMPYHAQGMGKDWEELTPQVQGVMLGALRGAGGGFLFTGVTLLLLLAVPFSRGERWAFRAVPALIILSALLGLYTTLTLTLLTPAVAPWPLAIVMAALAVLGVLLAPRPSGRSS